MRVNTKPRRQNSHRADAAKRCAPFLQWLRGRGCVFSKVAECEGKIEAAHLDFAGGKGVGTKVADQHAVPMCALHHRLQHKLGWNTFAKMMEVTKPLLLESSAVFWRAWPGRLAWERKMSDG